MRNLPAALALLLATTMAGAGCGGSTSRLRFPSAQVERLDGFRAGQTIELETLNGDVVEFTNKMMLRFSGPGGATSKVRCESIDIDGSLLTCVNRFGTAERIDLSRTPDAYILIRKSGSSAGKIALYVLGVYLAAAIVVAIAS